MKINPGTIQLTTTSSLIKNLFKPGSHVKAYVNKTEGENVIISVSNNTFKVKSQVSLQEGTWIKGKVFLDKGGTINLKLIETYSPKDQLQMKAEEFVKNNQLEKLPKATTLTRALMENNIKPTTEMVERLTPIIENFSQSQIRAIAWLLSNNLQPSSQNISGVQGYLEGNFNLPFIYSTGDNLILNFLTLTPELNPASGSEGQIFSPGHIKEIFNMFLEGNSAHNTLEEFISFLENSNKQGMELMNVFNLFQKLNLKSTLQNLPNFWGMFFLNISGELKPVEFYLKKRYIRQKEKREGTSYKSAYNIGLYLNLSKLGPLVIRFFYTPPILALKFSISYDITYNLIKSKTKALKTREGLKNLQIAKIDLEHTELTSVDKARKILSTPFSPLGNLDVRA